MSGKEIVKIFCTDFEVFGIVQGVFFRKHTQKKALELKISGWCRNTKRDTVEGQIQGEEKSFNLMKDWLRKNGSPCSRIEKTEFKNECVIEKRTLEGFNIKH